MARITPVLKTWKADKRGRHLVMLRFESGNRKRYLSLGFSVLPSQWNKRQRRVRAGHLQADKLNGVVESKLSAANNYVADCLLKDIPVTVDGIKSTFSDGSSSKDFWIFAEAWLNEKRRRDQIRYWKRSKAVLTKFRDSAGSPLPWHQLSVRVLKDFDLFMVELSNNGNTRGIAFRVLKTILSDAEHEGILSTTENPFVRFRMPEGEPVRRDWLSQEEIQRLSTLHFSPASLEQVARDMYLFSYWTRGTRFGDLALLKYSNIQDDRIKILIGKTGQHISVPVTERLEKIIDTYRSKSSSLVFPVLRNYKLANKEAIVSAVGSANARINRELKVIAKAAGIEKRLTFHTARHSFAHSAYDAGIDVKTVQQALAHSKASTTDQYLRSLDDSGLDATIESMFDKKTKSRL
jgi:integrase/recombinase XerD